MILLYLPHIFGLSLMFLGVSGYPDTEPEALYAIYTGVFLLMGVNWYVNPSACKQLQEFNNVTRLRRSALWRQNLGVPGYRSYSIAISSMFVIGFTAVVSPVALESHYGQSTYFSVLFLCVCGGLIAIPSFFLFSWRYIEADLTSSSISLFWYCVLYALGLVILQYQNETTDLLELIGYTAMLTVFFCLVLHGSYRLRVSIVQKQINEDILRNIKKW